MLIIWLMFLVNSIISGMIHHPHNSNDNGLVVQTSNGLIRGKLKKTFNKNIEYLAFLKIPFAKAPTGHRRFQAPEPSDRWHGIYDATKEGNECVQFNPNKTLVGKEDCLFLRVYTPKRDSENEELLTIMYYIHGGAFIEGSPTFDEYGPDLFIEKGVMVAFVQYRLGFYGFLSTEDMICPGNNGLKDQRLGLKWIKENAKAFGGDPNKITIFGQSAGSASVGYLVDTPTTAGLFRAAIQQSGIEIAYFSKQYRPKEKAFLIGKRFGVLSNNSTELIEKLKKIEYKKLYIAASLIGFTANHGDLIMPNFAPVIEPEHPDAIITQKPLQQLQNGDYNRVPIMLGFTSLEAVFFASLMEIRKVQIRLNITTLVPPTLVPKDYVTKLHIAKQIKKYYFGKNDMDYGLLLYVSDLVFVRPALEKSRIIARWSPTYLYKFSYIGALGNPTNPSRQGVGHVEELWYMFHRSKEAKVVSEADTKMRYQLVTLWTNFAKTLNPTPINQSLLDNVSWPRVSEKTGYQSLSINNKLSVQKRVNEANLKFWQKLFESDTAHIGWY